MIYVVGLALGAKLLTRKIRRINAKADLDYLAQKGYVVGTIRKTEFQRDHSEVH